MKRLWFTVALMAIIPALLWYSSNPTLTRFTPLRIGIFSFGQLAALIGLSLFSLNVILSARLPGIEKLFGPLNKISIVHHLIGIAVWILLALHPVGLFSVYGTGLFLPILSNPTIKLGSFTLFTLSTLLTLTLFIKIPYHIWKATHKYLGLVLLLGGSHAFLMGSDLSYNTPLRLYFLTILFLAVLSWLYHSSILRRYLVKKYHYQVDTVEKFGEITQIFFKPQTQKISFVPGQFAFFSFQSPGFSESHPFSLMTAPGSPLGVAAKDVGDFTSRLSLLKPGTQVLLEGPFGRFSYVFHNRPRQIWIAGGIGITPFFSMAESLPQDTPHEVDLYYVTHSTADAYGLKYLKSLAAKNPHLKLIHHQTSGASGRLTADQVIKTSGDLKTADIFICGPLPMMKSFRKQFNSLGVRHSHIHTEEFSLN